MGVCLSFTMHCGTLKRIVLVSLIAVSLSGCVQQRSEGTSSEKTGSLMVDGLERTYLLHVPPSYTKNELTPLVIALHGGGSTAEEMTSLTGFDTLSDREGFIVVYPQGVENHWNDGREIQEYRAHRDDIDDVGFIEALIDHLTEEIAIDKTRIYATGISNGAMMSCRLACELSEEIAAIAMVAGAMPEDFSAYCSPSRPISVLLMNGTEDRLILWGGGEIAEGARVLGRTLSVADTVKYWVDHNGCSSPTTTWLPDTDREDGTKVRKEVYGQGEEGTEVILYAIEGGGHTWPGGPQYRSKRVIGRTCRDIKGSEVIWQFFREHTRIT